MQAAIHVNLYVLASGKSIDLGGDVQQADYAAAWSPDGQWIAINRDDKPETNSNIGEMIWLVRPDGSKGHVLLEGLDSYSDLNWSPDGKYLIFDQTPILGNSQPQVWMADIQSGQVTKLMDGVITPNLVP